LFEQFLMRNWITFPNYFYEYSSSFLMMSQFFCRLIFLFDCVIVLNLMDFFGEFLKGRPLMMFQKIHHSNDIEMVWEKTVTFPITQYKFHQYHQFSKLNSHLLSQLGITFLHLHPQKISHQKESKENSLIRHEFLSDIYRVIWKLKKHPLTMIRVW
jgi:hypothetical protein